jgi:aquaporin NIP
LVTAKNNSNPTMRPTSQYAAEAIGTFILVFAGTGAVVFGDITDGQVTPLGIGLVFGLVVMALIYTLGDVSGAHINPAVTIAFWAAGKFPGRQVAPYIVSQCAGAILASLLLLALFGNHADMGATIPIKIEGERLVYQCLILETILTFILMFVILNIATGSREQGIVAGIAIGGVIAMEATFAGPISGASMNPARSLGPALVSWNFSSLWIYLLGPTLGALLAVPAWRWVRLAKRVH